jgi:hypothetical protein
LNYIRDDSRNSRQRFSKPAPAPPPAPRKAQSIADVLGARSSSKADLEYLFEEE